MASLLFNYATKRLGDYYENHEVTYSNANTGPVLPLRYSGFLGKSAYNDLSNENYDLTDIANFSVIWPLLKKDAEITKKPNSNIVDANQPISFEYTPLVKAFYQKIVGAKKNDSNTFHLTHHLTHNLECVHRSGTLINELGNEKVYEPTSAFADFVLNKDILNKDKYGSVKKRIGVITENRKRENLLFLLDEINNIEDINDPIRAALLHGLTTALKLENLDNINDLTKFEALLKLLIDAPKEQAKLVENIFRAMLKLKETNIALSEHVRQKYQPDAAPKENQDFALLNLYKQHKTCFDVACEYFTSQDAAPAAIQFLVPHSYSNFKHLFLERHYNNVKQTEKWQVILQHRVKQAWSYIAKIVSDDKNAVLKACESTLKNQLWNIFNSNRPNTLEHFKNLHFVLCEANHPDPIQLLVDILKTQNLQNPNDNVNTRLTKLLSSLDRNDNNFARKTIFNLLLDSRITSLLFDNRHQVLPEFIALVQKHPEYSSILQQRLLGATKPKVTHWQLARALTTPHFTQLLDKRSTFSFLANHPADLIATQHPQMIVDHLLSSAGETQKNLLNVISAERGVIVSRKYLRDFPPEQFGELLVPAKFSESTSSIQLYFDSLSEPEKEVINTEKQKIINRTEDDWAALILNKIPGTEVSLKNCVQIKFPENAHQQNQFIVRVKLLAAQQEAEATPKVNYADAQQDILAAKQRAIKEQENQQRILKEKEAEEKRQKKLDEKRIFQEQLEKEEERKNLELAEQLQKNQEQKRKLLEQKAQEEESRIQNQLLQQKEEQQRQRELLEQKEQEKENRIQKQLLQQKEEQQRQRELLEQKEHDEQQRNLELQKQREEERKQRQQELEEKLTLKEAEDLNISRTFKLSNKSLSQLGSTPTKSFINNTFPKEEQSSQMSNATDGEEEPQNSSLNISKDSLLANDNSHLELDNFIFSKQDDSFQYEESFSLLETEIPTEEQIYDELIEFEKTLIAVKSVYPQDDLYQNLSSSLNQLKPLFNNNKEDAQEEDSLLRDTRDSLLDESTNNNDSLLQSSQNDSLLKSVMSADDSLLKTHASITATVHNPETKKHQKQEQFKKFQSNFYALNMQLETFDINQKKEVGALNNCWAVLIPQIEKHLTGRFGGELHINDKGYIIPPINQCTASYNSHYADL